MDSQPVQDSKPVDLAAMIAEAVEKALASTRHQHAPIPVPVLDDLQGRTRDKGVLIVTEMSDGTAFSEVRFNDGTVRRDYK